MEPIEFPSLAQEPSPFLRFVSPPADWDHPSRVVTRPMQASSFLFHWESVSRPQCIRSEGWSYLRELPRRKEQRSHPRRLPPFLCGSDGHRKVWRPPRRWQDTGYCRFDRRPKFTKRRVRFDRASLAPAPFPRSCREEKSAWRSPVLVRVHPTTASLRPDRR